MTEHTRPEWEEYFAGVAKAVSKRADCRRRQVGCVIWDTETRIILSTGYNGTRAGALGCIAGGCPRGLLSFDEVPAYSDYNDTTSPGYCISTHGEMNAMLFATGPLRGASMAVTDKPCEGCRKAIYNAGLVRVIWPTGSYDFS